MKNPYLQENRTAKERTTQVVLPLNLGIMIEASEGVRLLLEITEGMDYSELNATYERKAKADEATPKQLF